MRLRTVATVTWGGVIMPIRVARLAVRAGACGVHLGSFAALCSPLLLGGANPSAVGAVAGVGVWAFVIGWLNRDGPGEVCTGSAANSSCTQEFAPWPSYIAGALMIGVAVVVFAVLQRRSARAR